MTFDYQEYLASREWAQKREWVRFRSENTCERCGGDTQQAVHHLTYENIGNEFLDELLAVCKPCHAYLSGHANDDPAEGMAWANWTRDQWSHSLTESLLKRGVRKAYAEPVSPREQVHLVANWAQFVLANCGPEKGRRNERRATKSRNAELKGEAGKPTRPVRPGGPRQQRNGSRVSSGADDSDSYVSVGETGETVYRGPRVRGRPSRRAPEGTERSE